jgi:pyruvate/2-oxoglutarate dehydrogenase complex dihydrolipoamide dehydrogenase (E3) component
MTEREAVASGRRVLIGRRPMSHVGRAVEKGETQGFMKVLVDADSKELLGAAILGTGGDEAIHCILDHDVCAGAVHRDAMGDAHSPHGV